MAILPNAVLKVKGITSTANPVEITPADGFHAVIKGGAVGSLWADTRTTGALISDYAQFRLIRAGIAKWRHGNNLAGDGTDAWSLYRDAEGALTGIDAITVNRTTLRTDFAGQVYAAGVLLGSGGTDASALSTGTVPVLRLGASGVRDATTYLRGDNTWATVSGGTGMPTTGGAFTGTVVWRNAANTVDTVTIYQDARINLRADNVASMSPGFQFLVPTEDAPFEDFIATFYVTGDRAIRCNYNYREPYVNGSSYARADKFQIHTGMEQDGAWFIRWQPPETVTPGTWDVPGKSFAIYSGGFLEGVGPSQTTALRTVDLCGLQAGRGIRIGASATTANPIFAVEFDTNGRINAFKRLGLGAATADEASLRFNTGVDMNPASAGDGDIWFDGTNLRMKIGGVVKVFTLT